MAGNPQSQGVPATIGAVEKPARFVGVPLKYDFDLTPGLLQLIQTARGERHDAQLHPQEQIKAAHDALQQIADTALAYYHAIHLFALLGHPWAARMLAEIASSATAATEAVVAAKPRDPMKFVPLYQSPEDRAKNDAHTLRPDTQFAFVLSFFREQRELPVLIRRHAKKFNQRKLQLAEAVQLGSGFGERVPKRRYVNPDNPVNRFIDRYLPLVLVDSNLAHTLPMLDSKPACRRWAVCMLDLFEQSNGAAIRHRLFASLLKYGPKSDKGKRGAIRDVIQDALFRRYRKQGVTGPQKPCVKRQDPLDSSKPSRRLLERYEKATRRTSRTQEKANARRDSAQHGRLRDVGSKRKPQRPRKSAHRREKS